MKALKYVLSIALLLTIGLGLTACENGMSAETDDGLAAPPFLIIHVTEDGDDAPNAWVQLYRQGYGYVGGGTTGTDGCVSFGNQPSGYYTAFAQKGMKAGTVYDYRIHDTLQEWYVEIN